MSRKVKVEPPENVEVWWCDSCQSEKMNRSQILDHLIKKHGLNQPIKVRRSMLEHWDASKNFGYLWEVMAEGIKLICSQTCSRKPKDPMKHESN